MAKTKKRTMWDILDRKDRGWSDRKICSTLKISRMSLAAFKANLTRQGYDY